MDNKKIKIVFFGSDYAPTGGGIATYSMEWMNSLVKNENVVDARGIYFANSKPRTEKISDKLSITTFKTKNFFIVGFRILTFFIKFYSYDVFHSFNLFPVGFWVIFWSKIFCKKGIITFHGADACDKTASPKTVFLQKWAIKNSHLTIAVSEFTKNIVSNNLGLSGENIKVIYAPVPENISNTIENFDAQNFRKNLSIKNDDFVVITVCRLVKRKGVDNLIRAIGSINNEKIKLIIIGNGPERVSLKNLVKNLNLEGRVVFAGLVPNVNSYYKIADLFVLASYHIKDEGDFEGLGLVLLEAQSFGVPVIGTRSGGIPEAMNDGLTGFVVEERDYKMIAEKIKYLFSNRDVLLKMKENTKGFLGNKFNNKRNIDIYLENL